MLKKAQEYEVRRYAPFVVAETSMPRTSGPADGTGFQDLATFIFGGNNRCAGIWTSVHVVQVLIHQQIDASRRKLLSKHDVSMEARSSATGQLAHRSPHLVAEHSALQHALFTFQACCNLLPS